MRLEANGYEVIAAHDGEAGLAEAAAQKPHLILLDVMMPEGTEGFHFVWRLRRAEDRQLAETPIIILTGIHNHTALRFYPEEGDGTYEPGAYLPVQEFVDKPVDSADLVQRVERVLAATGK